MRRRFEKLPFLLLGAVGFLFGMILAIPCRGKGEILDPEYLSRMRELAVDQKLLIYEILKNRMGMVMIIGMAGTTYLAPAVCMFVALWIGMNMGSFQTLAIARYGLKGILLLPATTMPQFLIYLPAFYFLLRWSEKLYGVIYQKQVWKKWNAVSGLVLILAAMAVGIFTEFRLGPQVLQGVLKIF